ncbi:NAD-dependent epimerase/dehydratase family protein [Candidatus Nomurabacteria bacterium]|nr:NAD-dependent epimerase/dehydratase family protein [Candidatus Nomurabacteria bacterium]
MKILVSGGAGFIGSHLVDSLIKNNHQVLIVDDLSTGLEKNLNPSAKFEKISIISPDLDQAVKNFQPEAIYHLAAQKNVRTSLENPKLDAEINILGSLNLLQAALNNQVKKFIFISTGGAIYGETEIIPTPENHLEQPLSPYGLAKLTFEKYLKILSQDKMSWNVLRLANVYGPRQDPQGEAGVIAIFLDNILKNLPLKINGDGLQTRDYVYVLDVVSAAVKVLDSDKNNIYNIGTGLEKTLLDLVSALNQASQKKAEVIHRTAVIGEVRRSCLSAEAFQRDFAWQAEHDLEQGLALTYQWFQARV